jgi:hypothetical protein
MTIFNDVQKHLICYGVKHTINVFFYVVYQCYDIVLLKAMSRKPMSELKKILKSLET